MNTSFFIARKYFIAKKTNLVNRISWISIASIMVSTAAMIIILSVMNGMNRFISQQISKFDPDLKISLHEGKFFSQNTLLQLQDIPGIASCIGCLEDQALIETDGLSKVIKLKGVDTGFDRQSHIQECIVSGRLQLSNTFPTPICVGYGLFAQMGMDIYESRPQLYILKSGNFNPQQLHNTYASFPTIINSVFNVLPEYDNQYVLAPLSHVQTMMDQENMLSHIEVNLREKQTLKKIKRQVQEILGNEFSVQDAFEQQDHLFKSIRVEKIIVISIFAFVILISTFTMISSLLLLIYEKKDNVGLLRSLGMQNRNIKKIFFTDGMLVALTGTLSGLLVGIGITLGQQKFGWVKLGQGGNYILSSYPVYLQGSDVVMIAILSLLIGAFASYIPTRSLEKKF